MMNDEEWAHFVEIYRELCKARADIWALSVMLRAVRFARQMGRVYNPALCGNDPLSR
jgi:hypothetical protein